MTMNEVIEQLETVKPNIYDEETKYRWLKNLDGMIAIEVMGQEPPVYEYPACMDEPLLVGYPFDDLYILYCASMVDFHNREYNNYNNTALMFSERLDAFKAWYIQRNPHGKARNFRNVMG